MRNSKHKLSNIINNFKFSIGFNSSRRLILDIIQSIETKSGLVKMEGGNEVIGAIYRVLSYTFADLVGLDIAMVNVPDSLNKNFC